MLVEATKSLIDTITVDEFDNNSMIRMDITTELNGSEI